MSDPERSKANVMAFYDMMFDQNRPREAIAAYAGDVDIQHNPQVGDGPEAFIACFQRMGREWPGKRVEFRRDLAEGDLVATHCFRHWPGDQDDAGIDIFRLTPEGRIVEHWDVLQVAPTTSANANGMF